MPYPVDEILKEYEILVKGIEEYAKQDDKRAYGGIIRAEKGKLVENIARLMVEIAWENLGGHPDRLSFDKSSIKVPLNKVYLDKIKFPEVREYIKENIDRFHYNLKTDIHVSIDNNFSIGIECKAYTENAMLKRILVDFTLLKSVLPNLNCVLIQLESQLTGDYSVPTQNIHFGSPSTHTLLSYFDVDLIIITLLEGERKVNEPIHKKNYYKELKKEVVQKSINIIEELLKDYI